MTRKGLMFTTAAAALSALPWMASVQAQDPPGPPPHRPEFGRGFGPGRGPGFYEQLGVSDEQKAQLEALKAKRDETLKPLMENARQAHEAFRKALEAESADATTVGQAALAMHAAEKKLHADREAAFEEMKSILTPEQREKLDQMMRERGPRRPGHGPREPRP